MLKQPGPEIGGATVHPKAWRNNPERAKGGPKRHDLQERKAAMSNHQASRKEAREEMPRLFSLVLLSLSLPILAREKRARSLSPWSASRDRSGCRGLCWGSGRLLCQELAGRVLFIINVHLLVEEGRTSGRIWQFIFLWGRQECRECFKRDSHAYYFFKSENISKAQW
jgi:hypothetical protein